MRVTICAVGRLKGGPQKSLIDDYLKRFDRTGRPLGLNAGGVVEIDERKATTSSDQSQALARQVAGSGPYWVLDERGPPLTSPEFAARLASRRDAGQGDLAICIGGADGLAPDVRDAAAPRVSFGTMVWPHMLARMMLAEQLYRAATILAGTPYHRS